MRLQLKIIITITILLVLISLKSNGEFFLRGFGASQPQFFSNATEICAGDKINLLANITKNTTCFFEVRIGYDIKLKEDIASNQSSIWNKNHTFNEENNYTLDVHCGGHYYVPSLKLKVQNCK
jgi:hypothetical protein